MMSEMCPSCGDIRAMNSASSTRTVIQLNGESIKKVTLSFSCVKCNQFVRSEEKIVDDK